jgi:antitoxin ParD1/3/4
MNITLGSEFENRIAQKVKSGFYTSASEVIRESLRMMFEQDFLKEKQFNNLQKQVSLGFNQLDSGLHSDEGIMDLFEQSVKNAK